MNTDTLERIRQGILLSPEVPDDQRGLGNFLIDTLLRAGIDLRSVSLDEMKGLLGWACSVRTARSASCGHDGAGRRHRSPGFAQNHGCTTPGRPSPSSDGINAETEADTVRQSGHRKPAIDGGLNHAAMVP